MNKPNIIKYILTLLISFLLLSPFAYARVITKEYSSYYLFDEAISVNSGNNITLSDTINTTSFLYHPYDTIKESEVVKVQKSCDKNDEDCMTLHDFFAINYSAQQGGKVYEVNSDNDTGLIEYSQNGNYYYLHGSYTNENGKTKPAGKSPVESYSIRIGDNKFKKLKDLGDIDMAYNILSCASIIPKEGVHVENVKDEKSGTLTSTIRRFYRNTFQLNWATYNLSSNNSSCVNGARPIYNNSEHEARILSPAVYKIVWQRDEYVCDPVETPSTTKCNSSNTITQNCDRKTITIGNNVVADVSINQSATVTNILTPDTLHQGGGFKFGFLYYNTVSWKINEISSLDGADHSGDIANEMKNMLKTREKLTDSIKIENISFGGKTLYSSLIQKKCQQSGTFEAGETVTTVCTFFLPKSVVKEYTGEVIYSSEEGDGINNMYYTPIDYLGKYNIKAALSGLNVLTGDNDDISEDWRLEFGGNNDESCQIDIYNRIYDDPNIISQLNLSFAFLYRPIDLQNPFPNRNPGVNWYDWYQNSNNREDLEKSYTNCEYNIEINMETLNDIKKYNSKHDDGYLDWDGINIKDGTSEFVKDYVTKGCDS